MANKKRPRLAEAIRGGVESLGAYNHLLDNLRTGKYELPENALNVYQYWQERFRLTKSKRQSNEETCKHFDMTARRVQQIRGSVERAIAQLKPWQRDADALTQGYNAVVQDIYRAARILYVESAYRDLREQCAIRPMDPKHPERSSQYRVAEALRHFSASKAAMAPDSLQTLAVTLARAFVRAHEQRKTTQDVANELLPAYRSSPTKRNR